MTTCKCCGEVLPFYLCTHVCENCGFVNATEAVTNDIAKIIEMASEEFQELDKQMSLCKKCGKETKVYGVTQCADCIPYTKTTHHENDEDLQASVLKAAAELLGRDISIDEVREEKRSQ